MELSDTAVVRSLIPPVADRGVPEHTVPELAYLQSEIFNPIQSEFPESQFRVNPERLQGLNDYSGVTLRISPMTSDGERYTVVDGGFTSWTARLLQNQKEQLLTSGIGTEFACRRYRLHIRDNHNYPIFVDHTSVCSGSVPE